MTLTQIKNQKSQGFKNSQNGYEGMCMSRGKFLKPWQVTDKIIEWIFIQFTFNILWVTLTPKKTTQGFKNSLMDIRGCVWVGEVSLAMRSDR